MLVLVLCAIHASCATHVSSVHSYTCRACCGGGGGGLNCEAEVHYLLLRPPPLFLEVGHKKGGHSSVAVRYYCSNNVICTHVHMYVCIQCMCLAATYVEIFRGDKDKTKFSWGFNFANLRSQLGRT